MSRAACSQSSGRRWEALDGSAAADALPLEGVLLHLAPDVELHRIAHGPGDAVVSPPTTRRLVVVLSGTVVGADCSAVVTEKCWGDVEAMVLTVAATLLGGSVQAAPDSPAASIEGRF